MSRHWMPLYIADYLADTAHLSTTEHGAYLLLIMHYWTKGGLPKDDETLRRITRMTTRQWSQSRDVLRSLFGDEWRHRRIDHELAQVSEKSKVNSANAKRSHDVRKANAERTHTQSQSQSQTEKKEVDTRAGDLRQAVVQAYAEANSPTIPDTARCDLWVSKGYDPEICLAVIKTVVKRKPNASLAYFDAPIAEAHASRAPPRLQLVEPPRHDWEAAAKLWKAIRRWPKGHGNDPDSPACICPRDILQKHGIAGAA